MDEHRHTPGERTSEEHGRKPRTVHEDYGASEQERGRNLGRTIDRDQLEEQDEFEEEVNPNSDRFRDR